MTQMRARSGMSSCTRAHIPGVGCELGPADFSKLGSVGQQDLTWRFTDYLAGLCTDPRQDLTWTFADVTSVSTSVSFYDMNSHTHTRTLMRARPDGMTQESVRAHAHAHTHCRSTYTSQEAV